MTLMTLLTNTRRDTLHNTQHIKRTLLVTVTTVKNVINVIH
jgi:hypothetical protein